MDDYEKWEQDLHSKSIDELETLIHDYDDTISQLQSDKQTIEDQLYMLRNQAPVVRRIYNLRVKEENAKQQEKTL
jgi:Mg2+ and Co2+ transporter CorA